MREPAALGRAAQAAENLWRRVEAEFGMLTAAQAGALLGAPRAEEARAFVTQKRRECLLLGVDRGRGVLYPGFQFDRTEGSVLPVIADLRRLGAEHGYNEATLIQWLCSPTTYLDDGDGARPPVDLLVTDPDRVLDVAGTSWGVQW